jgi:predicted aldo/keto reductase-like oxidoreductase
MHILLRDNDDKHQHMKKKITRREFVQNTTAAAAAISLTGVSGCTASASPFDPKGMPTTTLGDTGVRVPLLGFGCGSRWMSVEDNEEALSILQFALDQGLYYWDTAASYGNEQISSEERIGLILKDQREKVFLVTKTGERDAEKARESIERSLTRMQTDYIDLLHVHSIKSVEDAEQLGESGKVLEVLREYKKEGIIRHIGFTGHTSAAGMRRAAELYDFEVMMMALKHHSAERTQAFEEDPAPFAMEKKMGVVAMKVVRPRENVESIAASDLVNYALSLKDFHMLNIGIDSQAVLEENIRLVRDFTPMDDVKMQEIRLALQPFYRGERVAWMKPGYQDGWNPVSIA